MKPRDRYVELQAFHANARDLAHARSVRLGGIRATTFMAAAAALVLWDVIAPQMTVPMSLPFASLKPTISNSSSKKVFTFCKFALRLPIA